MRSRKKPAPVFVALNRHAAACGEPPELKTEPGCYAGYFENGHGEQWVVTIDRSTKRGQLRGGDCGWEKVFDIAIAADGTLTGIPVLNGPEQDWLRACVRAALT
jgi:hypothetical protein